MEFSDVVALKIKELMKEKDISIYKNVLIQLSISSNEVINFLVL